MFFGGVVTAFLMRKMSSGPLKTKHTYVNYYLAPLFVSQKRTSHYDFQKDLLWNLPFGLEITRQTAFTLVLTVNNASRNFMCKFKLFSSRNHWESRSLHLTSQHRTHSTTKATDLQCHRLPENRKSTGSNCPNRGRAQESQTQIPIWR